MKNLELVTVTGKEGTRVIGIRSYPANKEMPDRLVSEVSEEEMRTFFLGTFGAGLRRSLGEKKFFRRNGKLTEKGCMSLAKQVLDSMFKVARTKAVVRVKP